MRLHLDSSISGTADSRASAIAGAGSPGGLRGTGDTGSRDSVSISGTTTVLNQIASDRALRLQQISDAVTNGGYRISSATIANSILAQATL